MHPEDNRPLSDRPQFGGSVQVIPLPPFMTEFIGNGQMRAFPIHALDHFVLETNPANLDQKRELPPDQLTLDYATATVVLKGWRLEFMLEPLTCGRLARVHALPGPLAQMTLEEPWVTEIHIGPTTPRAPGEGGALCGKASATTATQQPHEFHPNLPHV